MGLKMLFDFIKKQNSFINSLTNTVLLPSQEKSTLLNIFLSIRETRKWIISIFSLNFPQLLHLNP
jgi:hypothetical protein